MSEVTIIKCRICRKLLKRYVFCVYPGDPTCCKSCNDKAEE